MKITVPEYYPKFSCIAGECTDTCCAGWDVDVDPAAYGRYRSIIERKNTPISRKLKDVCVPGEDGGCTFRLDRGLRCPFLNHENLCDLIIAEGKDSLCDTCAEFPRFKTVYGNRVEMGLAPSCITACEIMLSSPLPFRLMSGGDDGRSPEENDIDPREYFRLKKLRKLILNRINDEKTDICEALRFCLSGSGQESAQSGPAASQKDENTARKPVTLAVGERDYQNTENHLLDRFEGMEIINADWNLVLAREEKLKKHLSNSPEGEWGRLLSRMYTQVPELDREARQIAAYDVYRYLLPSVYTHDETCRRKIPAFTYLVTERMYAGYFLDTGSLPFAVRVDLQHLWSRQFEHSYVNFSHYQGLLSDSGRYGRNRIAAVLTRDEIERKDEMPHFLAAGVDLGETQDEEAMSGILTRLERLLPSSEQKRADEIRRPSDRVLSIAGRLLYEDLREQFLDKEKKKNGGGKFFLTPEELAHRIERRRAQGKKFPDIQRGYNGKPMDGEGEVYFSIAHSRTAVVCAVSGESCGIDMEDQNRKTTKIVEKIFRKEEMKELEGLSGDARMRKTVMLYTRAEAEVKRSGEGIGGLRKRQTQDEHSLVFSETRDGHYISLAFLR
ncbi:MAG: flagellin lysine-N-methylase [Lachnospiraceae bacterium]